MSNLLQKLYFACMINEMGQLWTPKSNLASRVRSRSGYTLIELMMVISILAILAVVGISSLVSSTDQQRFDVTLEKMHKIREAMVGKWEATKTIATSTSTVDGQHDASWTPQWDHLVGYWQFNGSGAISDGDTVPADVGNDGVVSHSDGSTAFYTSGMVGQSLHFGTTCELIKVPHYAGIDNMIGTMSMAFWMRRAIDGSYIHYWSGGKGPTHWVNAAQKRIFAHNGVYFWPAATFPNDSIWNHVVWTTDGTGGTARVYINGVLSNSASPASYESPANFDLELGAAYYGTPNTCYSNLNADIDDFALWDVALDAAEVATIYNTQLNATNPLPALDANLEIALRLDEPVATSGAGSVRNYGNNSAHFTPTNVTLEEAGQLGTSALFSGSSTLQSTATVDLTGTQKLSFSFWYKRPTTVPNAGIILESGTGYYLNTVSFVILQWAGVNATMGVLIKGDSGTIGWDTGVITPNVWHHIGIVLDKSLATEEAKIYVDGVLNGASTYGPADNTNSFGNQTLFLGSRNASAVFLNGSYIDDFRIWTTALTQDQFVTIMNYTGTSSNSSISQSHRKDFGFLGDIGAIPTAGQGIAALTTNPGLPAWARDTTARIGVGWNGPYLPSGLLAEDFTIDEWGTAFVYNPAASPPTITSYGADRAAGGTGLNQDITIDIPAAMQTGNVHGVLLNEDGSQFDEDAELEIYYPDGAGVRASSTTTITTGDEGAFSFSNLPLGHRSIMVYLPAKVGALTTAGPFACTLSNAENTCRIGTDTTLIADQTDDDDTGLGFSGGTMVGVNYGTLNDGSTSGLELASNGGCDGTASNCSTFDAEWTPQYSSMIAHWKLDNNGNDAVGANHGTLVGTPPFSTSSKVGSHAMDLPTTAGKYVSVASGYTNLLKTDDTHTISYWFNATSFASGPVPLDAIAGTGGSRYFVQLESTKFHWVCGSTRNYTYNFDTNTWYHVAMVKTGAGDSGNLYINGELVTTYAGTIGSTPNVDSDLFIGNYRTGSLPLWGKMDEFAIWNVALTAAEVREIYERQVPTRSGYMISRVMNSLVAGSSWSTLSWFPTLPFFKALPTTDELQSNYTALVDSTGVTGDSDLSSGLVGLWHLDETTTGTAPGGKDFKDSSSTGNHANRHNANLVFPASGRIGSGISIPLSAASCISSIGTVSSYNFIHETGVFTLSLWVKSSRSYASQQWALANSPGGGRGFYVIVDTRATLWRYQASVEGTGMGVPRTAVGTVDGQWHHLVFKGDGTTASLYMDSVFIAGYNMPSLPVGDAGQTLGIGCTGSGGSASQGSTIDEVAIWNRTLHDNEIKQLYQRGAARLKYQIRSCDDAACAGETWVGPDGTTETYFSELHNMSSQSATPSGTVNTTLPVMTFSNFTTPPSNNQYFQYQVILESDSSTTALMPELKSVVVGPAH